MEDLDVRLAHAVQHFWKTRSQQGKRQGVRTGRKDYGNRTAATGGKQLDRFVLFFRDLSFRRFVKVLTGQVTTLYRMLRDESA